MPLEQKKQSMSDAVFLRQLLEHNGWKIVRQHLQENLDWLTERALDAVDETLKGSVTLTKREMFIKWRSYVKILMELPENIIKSLESGSPVEQPSDFDPYFREKDFELK